MSTKTTNYGAARSVLGLAEIVLWCGVGGGVILAFIAGGAVSSGFGGAGAGLAAAIPGIAISVFSFIGVVMIQMAKASVDTADYTFQMLGIARDQLAVSKEANKQLKAPQSFAQAQPTERPVASPPKESFRKPEPAEPAEAPGQMSWDYRGKTLVKNEYGYVAGDQTFISLALAKSYIDNVLDTQIEERGGQYWVAGQNFLKLENAQAYVDEHNSRNGRAAQ